MSGESTSRTSITRKCRQPKGPPPAIERHLTSAASVDAAWRAAWQLIAIFAVIGIGLGYFIGRMRGTRMWVRFIKGAVYGVLTAGSVMPFFILFDDMVVRFW